MAPANSTGGELFNDATGGAYIGVEARTMAVWRKTKGLPFIRLSAKCVRYRRADLDAWIARHRVAMTA